MILTLGVDLCVVRDTLLVMIHTSTKFHGIMFSGAEVMVQTNVTVILPLTPCSDLDPGRNTMSSHDTHIFEVSLNNVHQF